MARWKLLHAHYLNVPGSEWQYSEISRTTGKPIRKVFAVPQLLDPDIEADCNYKFGPEGSEIIVSNGKNAQPQDIIFEGPPTPDMLPLDDEAKTISAGFAGVWNHPIESLPGQFSERLLDDMQAKLSAAITRQTQSENTDLSELIKVLTKTMEQNAEIISKLATPARRV